MIIDLNDHAFLAAWNRAAEEGWTIDGGDPWTVYDADNHPQGTITLTEYDEGGGGFAWTTTDDVGEGEAFTLYAAVDGIANAIADA